MDMPVMGWLRQRAWVRWLRGWFVARGWRHFTLGRQKLEERLSAQCKANVAMIDRIGEHKKFEDELVARIGDLETQLKLQRGLAEARCGFPDLSLAELERVAILAEECGEVVQVCGKILRHGWESCSPFDPRCRPNRVLLERELGDVRAAVDLLASAGDVRKPDIASWHSVKCRALREWTHHQGFEKSPKERVHAE